MNRPYWVLATLPLVIPINKNGKRPFRINLNQYQAAHHHRQAKAKRNFAQEMDRIYPQGIDPIPFHPPYDFFYILESKIHWFSDLGNAASVLDKYTADYLQDINIIPDDTFDFVSFLRFGFVGLVKDRDPVAMLVVSPLTDPFPRGKMNQIKEQYAWHNQTHSKK